MSDKKKGIFLIIALLGVMSVSVLGTETQSKLVTLDYYGTVTEVETKANTLEDLLYVKGIELDEYDTLSHELDTALTDDVNIVITEGVSVTFIIDGEETEYLAKADTAIGTAIGDLKEKKEVEHIYTSSYATLLEDGETYELNTIRDEIERHNEILPYETIYIEVDHLDPFEEEIITYGLEGTKEVIITKSMFGLDVTQEKVEEIILIEPITEVINIGAENKVATENGYVPYSKVLTMEATAYTAGFESTGKNPGDPGYGITASGMVAQRGVVAVDPSFIPLGTTLYVEGYGTAIAADTGGAINNNKIDLFYESVSDALQFGRRNVTVYILN